MNSEGYPPSSLSIYSSAANPCGEDFEDEGGCDKGNAAEQISQLDCSSIRQRSISSLDTPVMKSKNIFLRTSQNFNSIGVSTKHPLVGNGSAQERHSCSKEYSDTSSVKFNGSYIRCEYDSRHSDFTIPRSNSQTTTNVTNGVNSIDEPPPVLQPSLEVMDRSIKVRKIVGNDVSKTYRCTKHDRMSIFSSRSPKIATHAHYGSIPAPSEAIKNPNVKTTTTPLPCEDASRKQLFNCFDVTTSVDQQNHLEKLRSPPTLAQHKLCTARMTPRVFSVKEYLDHDNYYNEIVENAHSTDIYNCKDVYINGESDPKSKDLLSEISRHSRQNFRKSVHAQSLLVGIAFMVVWLPNNAMAPNLTQMASFYGMNEAERDLYLGSYCALALGVFCLPLSGVIGFMADFYPRKHLFLACCVFGALSAALSGWAPNYWNLFLARLCSGGCMSGSVPVAFSLMGDLFSKEERNAASSGLTSMMGLGIILGQIFAGEVGPEKSWQYPFFVSALLQLSMAFVIAIGVEEPVRGGKEKALEGVFQSGNKYERRLTLKGFIDTMHKNDSNWILLWQGFLTSLPWGIVFVFLNDYLSQEKGFSVEQATFLVMLFGVGCAIGGITGGYLGQLFMKGNRSYLPVYMGTSTILGIFPFLFLLNSDFSDHSGFLSKFYSVLGGCVASLPSVNVRPCIINVNPPESRGAALTAANLFVTLGRGIGPSCIVLLGSIFNASRQSSFSITLSVFWTISGIQLFYLANTLPVDQDSMEEELARYAAATRGNTSCKEDGYINEEQDSIGNHPKSPTNALPEVVVTDAFQPITPGRTISLRNDDDELIYKSIISSPPAQYITIDGESVRQSLEFVKLGIQEFGDGITLGNANCRGCDTISPCESYDDLRLQNTNPLDGKGNQHKSGDVSASIQMKE